jgi:hypothetical protein
MKNPNRSCKAESVWLGVGSCDKNVRGLTYADIGELEGPSSATNLLWVRLWRAEVMPLALVEFGLPWG